MQAGESDTCRQERVTRGGRRVSVHTTRQGTCLVLLSKASQVRVCVRCPQGVGRPYHRSCPYHRSLAGSSACRTPTCMPFSTSALPTYRSLRPQHVSLSCGQRSFRATVARRSRNPAELQCEPRVVILQHGMHISFKRGGATGYPGNTKHRAQLMARRLPCTMEVNICTPVETNTGRSTMHHGGFGGMQR